MNAFIDIADRQIASPVKARHRAAEKRAAHHDADKELREQQELTAQWRKWHREQEEALIAGRHGREVKALISMLRTMDLTSAPALVGYVKRAQWLLGADRDTKHIVLGIIDRHIIRLRERNGLDPFDDRIDDQGPPTAFEQIREVLR